jgi:ribulose-phosphate 3-epimerase
MMVRISASILSFYFDAKKHKWNSQTMIDNINNAIAKKYDEFDILHLDIEDGKFVEQHSFKPSEIRKIKCDKKREAHFMVVNYKKYLKEYFNLADMFIFHEEVIRRDFPKTIEFLKENKKFVGISINPNTPIDDINYLDNINLVLVMSVYPGLPGQKFIETTIRRVRKIKDIRTKRRLKFVIEVDGGINNDNIKRLTDAGADIVVMGTGLFG